MSRGDEVRAIAHNVLHVECAIKIATLGHSYPIMRRSRPTSKRSTIPAAMLKLVRKREKVSLTGCPQSEKDVMVQYV